jgi:hypothetical protein
MNVTLNILELASELAYEKLLNHYNDNTSLIYEYDESGDSYYTDEAQDLFNEYYDEYYEMIEKISNHP